jgi:hypothetical protein
MVSRFRAELSDRAWRFRKSTFIDAIDLVLGARRSYTFSDADFYLMNSATPVCISVTLGQLDDGLRNLRTMGVIFVVSIAKQRKSMMNLWQEMKPYSH